MIAFSIALSWLASQGWITIVRASGTEMDAIWLTGVGVP
jgi:hypothetical protein